MFITITYGLGIVTLNQTSINTLNINQNNLVRQMFNLRYTCHMSDVLKVLKILKFYQPYLFSKLSFIEAIRFNSLASGIFEYIIHNITIGPSKSNNSFEADIQLLTNHFNLDFPLLLSNKSKCKRELKGHFLINDDISDSIKMCLENLRFKDYSFFLIEQIRSKRIS